MNILARWRCPFCQDGKLAPSKPRRDNVRRYCLACSAKTGRLVERVSPRLENVRAKRAEAAREKRKRRHVFKPPPEYFIVGGVDLEKRKYKSKMFSRYEFRTRVTKGPGPVTFKDGIITFRKGPWADRHDAEAQIAVAYARADYARGGRTSELEFLRDYFRRVDGFGRISSVKQAERQVAKWYRAKAATYMLGTMERKSA